MHENEVPALVMRFAEQSSENALMITDKAGTIVWCNETCARLFNYAPNALMGRSMQCVFTPDDVKKRIPEYELEVAANSDDINNDRWMQRSDGSQFWATGNTVGLRDTEGEVVGFVKILRDSTDVKEQLETARNQCKLLAEKDRQKTKFLATFSHEVRNPLSAMANGIEIIKARPETGFEAVGLLERQLKHLSRLADDLLDITRISTGTVELNLQVLDMREPIANAVESVRPLIERRGHRIAQHILDTPMMINADKLRLEQVFANLLTNAAKYTPEGGQIEVRASIGPAEAWVHIIDDGIGIPTETLPHVFELFTRGDGASEHAKDGLGIGLSLVKEFIGLHGGTVQVRSDGPGKGSEFTVRLPLAQPTDSQMPVSNAPRALEPGNRASTGR